MQTDHPVMQGQTQVGRVQISRQGLYYQIVCFCRLSGDVMYRLWAETDGRRESLGILVPEGSSFGLRTRIPVKRIGDGNVSFFIEPKTPKIKGKFVPLCPEEPFSYIARLKDAYLLEKDGMKGIVIPE